MRVYEAKIVYSLVSLGEEVRLDRPEKVADYLRSAFDENPMLEASYSVYHYRKNQLIGPQGLGGGLVGPAGRATSRF